MCEYITSDRTEDDSKDPGLLMDFRESKEPRTRLLSEGQATPKITGGVAHIRESKRNGPTPQE